MTKVLTKLELTTILKEEDLQLSASVAAQLTEAFFEGMAICLERGEKVKLSGLGSFRVKEKKARSGRNPKTGIEVLITPRNVVLFQASAKLKNKIKLKKTK